MSFDIFETDLFSKEYLSGRKILIIEDDEIIRTTFDFITKNISLECDLAADGYEAVLQCHKKVYDAIILDWHVPNLSGKSILKLIDEYLSENFESILVPFLVYSSSSEKQIKLPKMEHLFYCGHLQKPTSASVVMKELLMVL